MVSEVVALNQITFEDLVAKFAAGDSKHDELEARELLEKTARRNDATHLVLFENLQMDSSSFGRRTVVCIGPSCTYKTLSDVRGKHLHDLPSQRQYARYYTVLR